MPLRLMSFMTLMFLVLYFGVKGIPYNSLLIGAFIYSTYMFIIEIEEDYFNLLFVVSDFRCGSSCDDGR